MTDVQQPPAPQESATHPDGDRSRPTKTGRDFSFQLSAYSVQTLGEGVIIAALPLLASKMTSDPKLISWVSLAHELPWLLLALPCGVLVDRHDRRDLIIKVQAAQGLLLFLFAMLASFGLTSLWMVYALAFALCTGDILFTGASRAMIPSLVPAAALETANSRMVTGETIGKQFAGPPLGSALFAFVLPFPFWFNAVTYLASLLLLCRIRSGDGRFVPERQAPRPGRGALFAEATEGLRWLMRHRVLRIIMLLAAVCNFGAFMALSIQVLFAKEVLGIGDAGYGLLIASMAIGGIIGATFSRRIVVRHGTRRVAVTVSLGSSLSLIAIGLIGRQPAVVVALYAVWSAGLAVWNVMSQSLSQRLTPDEIRGRVGAGSRMVAFGALPLGALAGGFAADLYGLTAPWIIGGAVHLTVTLAVIPVILRWPRDLVVPPQSRSNDAPAPT